MRSNASAKNDFATTLNQTKNSGSAWQANDAASATGFCVTTTMIPVEIAPYVPEPEYDKVESIYDIPREELQARLYKAVNACWCIDTTGMTEGEIYTNIRSTFENYFGKDFLEPAIFYGSMGMLSPIQEVFPLHEYQNIHNQFTDMLYRRGSSRNAYIEVKGFTGMSKDEMYIALRNEYPENMTLKDCLLMSYEIGKLGIETIDYGRAVAENIFETIELNSAAPNSLATAIKAKQIFAIMLDMPADMDKMKQATDVYLLPDGSGRHMFTHYARMSKTDVLRDLLSWFGGDDLYGMELAHTILTMLDTPRHFYWQKRSIG